MLKKYIITIGNPGSGKSTLLNTMLRQIHFKSGSSIGSGLTFKLDEFTKDGVTYMDTPGLSDIDKRKQAAAAITEALKKEGEYRVFFIVILDHGRLRTDDVSLISLVLESAPDITSYSLILNQVHKRVKRKLTGDVEIYQMLMTGGIAEHQLPKDFCIVDMDDDIYSADNEMLTNPGNFCNFVDNTIPVNIYARNVNDIRFESYDELRKELDEKVQEFKEKEEEMKRDFEEAIKKVLDQRNEDRTRYEALKHENEAARKKMETKHRILELEMSSEKELRTRLERQILTIQVQIRDKDIEKEELQKSLQKNSILCFDIMMKYIDLIL